MCVSVYLGGSVAEAFEQQGDNMNSSSSDLCLLLSLYQGSETGAQLCASSQTEKHININGTKYADNNMSKNNAFFDLPYITRYGAVFAYTPDISSRTKPG